MTKVSSSTVDLTVGARRYLTFEDSPFRFYAGFGGGYVTADTAPYLGNQNKIGDSDSTLGGWLELGASVPVSDYRIGLQYRIFRGGKTTLFDESANNDFNEFSLFFQLVW